MLEYGGACRVECLGPRGTSTKSMTGSRLRVCLSVFVSVSVSVRESAVPGRVQVCVMPNVTRTFNSFECPSIRA